MVAVFYGIISGVGPFIHFMNGILGQFVYKRSEIVILHYVE